MASSPMSERSVRFASLLALGAMALSGFQCLGQNQAASDGLVPYRPIGKITPRSAKEIASSDWSIGCETLDRDLADYSKYKVMNLTATMIQ